MSRSLFQPAAVTGGAEGDVVTIIVGNPTGAGPESADWAYQTADLETVAGAPIGGGQVKLKAGGMTPRFYGPDGVTTLKVLRNRAVAATLTGIADPLSATGTSLASPGPGDAGKVLAVNGTEDGYELVSAPSGGSATPPVCLEVKTWGDNANYYVFIRGDETFYLMRPEANAPPERHYKVFLSGIVSAMGAGGRIELFRQLVEGDTRDLTIYGNELIVHSLDGTERINAYFTSSGLLVAPPASLDPPYRQIMMTGSYDVAGTDLSVVSGGVESAAGGDFVFWFSAEVALSDPS